MNVTSFDEVWGVLAHYRVPASAQGEVYKLDNMRAIMQNLGNPQDSYKVIHVAGTSGKTSTAYYAAALLVQAGKKVGLTVSPHVKGINERLQINMVPVAEKRYCELFSAFITIFEASGIKATTFELLASFAYWSFVQEKVDYAVVEVGLGGLLDGTNVVNSQDKVCMITDIGIDHTEVLGKTVTEIAAQKAGIIHPHNTVFMYDQGDEVMDVVREVASQQQAELHEVWPLNPKELPTHLPLFQRRNWYLALSTVSYIAQRDGMPKLSEKQLAQSTKIQVPARMEVLQIGGKTVVLDGAHNAQKMSTLVESLQDMFPKKTFAVLFSLVRSKNFRLRTSVESILSLRGHVIITSFNIGQEFQRMSVDPARVAEHCHVLGYDNWEMISDPKSALQAALKRPEDILLITGSFYLIDQLHSELYRGI